MICETEMLMNDELKLTLIGQGSSNVFETSKSEKLIVDVFNID